MIEAEPDDQRLSGTRCSAAMLARGYFVRYLSVTGGADCAEAVLTDVTTTTSSPASTESTWVVRREPAPLVISRVSAFHVEATVTCRCGLNESRTDI